MRKNLPVGIPHLKGDHPQSENVRFTGREAGFSFIVDAKKLGCHPSMGTLEPGRRSYRTVETSDAGEPEVIESRTTRLVDEDILLRWEAKLLPAKVWQRKKLRRTPFKSPCTISRECKYDKPRLTSSNWTCFSSSPAESPMSRTKCNRLISGFPLM